MTENYHYIDPDYHYTDPKTGVLRNLGRITHDKELIVFEGLCASKRTKELQTQNLTVKDASTLFDIHQYLFQDVYPWAGQLRTVEISKDGKPFLPLKRFSTGMEYINQLVAEYKTLGSDQIQPIAHALATILDAVNFLHPFREGNGRTQREFLRILAAEKGFHLNLNPVDSNSTYKRYMMGTINGDIEVLTQLIIERCTPIPHDVN